MTLARDELYFHYPHYYHAQPLHRAELCEQASGS